MIYPVESTFPDRISLARETADVLKAPRAAMVTSRSGIQLHIPERDTTLFHTMLETHRYCVPTKFSAAQVSVTYRGSALAALAEVILIPKEVFVQGATGGTAAKERATKY